MTVPEVDLLWEGRDCDRGAGEGVTTRGATLGRGLVSWGVGLTATDSGEIFTINLSSEVVDLGVGTVP